MRGLQVTTALTPLGAAAASSTSTRAAFDKVKARGDVRICRPSDAPFKIPDANARIYVLGPPHDPKLIRKINPSTANPETYGLAMNGNGALPLGVLVALDNRDDAENFAVPRQDAAARDQEATDYHEEGHTVTEEMANHGILFVDGVGFPVTRR
jgi:hypothetical protein